MRAVIPLALALVLGLGAAVMVHNATARREGGAPSVNTVAVVTAKQDLEAGHSLSAEDLDVNKVPAEFAPSGVFSDPAQLVGRVTVTALSKSQTIIETLLAPTGSGAGLQALVPPGQRAFTLNVSECSSVGGMLTPGCHVDILVTLVDTKTGQNASHTVLQNMKVTAVGRALTAAAPAPGQPPAPPAGNVTILCTPQQAQVLQLAMTMSQPWLVLRGGRDSQAEPVQASTVADFGLPTRPTAPIAVSDPTPAPARDTTPPIMAAASVPATPKRVMDLIRGGNETQVTFALPLPPAPPEEAVSDTDPGEEGR